MVGLVTVAEAWSRMAQQHGRGRAAVRMALLVVFAVSLLPSLGTLSVLDEWTEHWRNACAFIAVTLTCFLNLSSLRTYEAELIPDSPWMDETTKIFGTLSALLIPSFVGWGQWTVAFLLLVFATCSLLTRWGKRLPALGLVLFPAGMLTLAAWLVGLAVGGVTWQELQASDLRGANVSGITAAFALALAALYATAKLCGEILRWLPEETPRGLRV